MVITKNKVISLDRLNEADRLLESVSKIVEEHKTVAVESVLLGLTLNGRLSSYETEMIAAAFATGSRPIITKDSETVYFETADNSNPNLIISVQQGELAFSDPLMKHQELAINVYSDWQSIKEIALSVHLKFSKYSAILVSRSSGRVVACSKEFCRYTDINESDIIGTEFGSAKGTFLQLLGNTKMKLDNIQAGELFLSLVTFTEISSANGPTGYGTTELSPEQSKLAESIRIIDEVAATDIHTSRLNSLLEENLDLAISDRILSELDSVSSRISEICDSMDSSGTIGQSSSNFKAIVRLISQSILMTHRAAAGTDIRTTLKLISPVGSSPKILFETDISSNNKLENKNNEWWKLATKLSGNLGFSLVDISADADMLISELTFNFKECKNDD